MKIKIQFAVLVALLVFLGTYLEQNNVHNQQIVIQFSNSNISSDDAEQTIEVVKKQLQTIGATNIQIGQHKSGKLKITYYSNTDIERIQTILSLENTFSFKYDSEHKTRSDLPVNRNLNDYELNISEIHNNSDVNWNFDGIQIVELNQKSDRYDKLKDKIFEDQLPNKHGNRDLNVAKKVNKTVVLAFDNIFYIIPEVRAGPTYTGII